VTIEVKRTVLAFAVAPLATPLVWWLVFELRGSWSVAERLGGLALVVVSAAPVIYAVGIALGVPVYLAISRWSQLRLWHPVVFGTVIGGIVMPRVEPVHGGAKAVFVGAMLGAVSGGVFWFIWRCPTRRCSGSGPRLRSEPGR
jgi:hypothetical protein